MALLSAPEVAIVIAIGIAKTLIARSCVMLLGELFNAIGQRLETPNLRSPSNGDQTPQRKQILLQAFWRSKRL